MKAETTRRADRYTNGAKVQAHGALAVEVRIVSAFNAALSAGACALAARWGFALPAAGLALMFAVSLISIALLRGGRGE